MNAFAGALDGDGLVPIVDPTEGKARGNTFHTSNVRIAVISMLVMMLRASDAFLERFCAGIILPMPTIFTLSAAGVDGVICFPIAPGACVGM